MYDLRNWYKYVGFLDNVIKVAGGDDKTIVVAALASDGKIYVVKKD